MRRDSFVFFTSWIESIDGYSEVEQAEIIFALVKYCAYGIEPDLSKPYIKLAFNLAKSSIDKNYKRYLERVQKSEKKLTSDKPQANHKQTNGEPVVNKTLTSGKQMVNQRKGDNDNDNVYDNDNVIKEKEKEKEKVGQNKFCPPSHQEVLAYMKQYVETKAKSGVVYQFEEVDAETFIRYYNSNGWMVGKNKMKNWKEAACGFVIRQQEFKYKKSPNHYQSNNGIDNIHFEGEYNPDAYKQSELDWERGL